MSFGGCAKADLQFTGRLNAGVRASSGLKKAIALKLKASSHDCDPLVVNPKFIFSRERIETNLPRRIRFWFECDHHWITNLLNSFSLISIAVSPNRDRSCSKLKFNPQLKCKFIGRKFRQFNWISIDYFWKALHCSILVKKFWDLNFLIPINLFTWLPDRRQSQFDFFRRFELNLFHEFQILVFSILKRALAGN